jgi:hypothetical protein
LLPFPTIRNVRYLCSKAKIRVECG